MALLTRVFGAIESRIIGGNKLTVAVADTSSALLDASINTAVLAAEVVKDVTSPINVDNYTDIKTYTTGAYISLVCEMRSITLEDYRNLRTELNEMSQVDRDLYIESLGFSNTKTFINWLTEVEVSE